MMARYLAARFDQGASPETLKLAVAAVRWLARKTGRPSPAGERTRDTIKRLAEDGTDRGRGQVSPLTYDEAIRIVTLARPIDGAIVALLFMAGMRRSEVAALTWRDIEDGTGGTIRITIRTSKTNRDGAAADVRLVKNGFADALRSIRPADAAPERSTMTEHATQRAPQPIPEPTPIELAPTDYQPSKAELEEEFDMPGMTMDEVRETLRRPFKIVRWAK